MKCCVVLMSRVMMYRLAISQVVIPTEELQRASLLLIFFCQNQEQVLSRSGDQHKGTSQHWSQSTDEKRWSNDKSQEDSESLWHILVIGQAVSLQWKSLFRMNNTLYFSKISSESIYLVVSLCIVIYAEIENWVWLIEERIKVPLRLDSYEIKLRLKRLNSVV